MSYLDGFMRPDYGSDPGIIGLAQFVQSGYDAGKARAQNDALRQLSQKAYTDTGDAQQQDIAQMVGINPTAGYQAAQFEGQQAAQQRAQKLAQFQRIGKLASGIADAWQRGDKTTAEALYQASLPELGLFSAQNGGPQPPPTLDQSDIGAVFKVASMWGQMPKPQDPYTLTPGSKRYNADNQLVASVPAAPKTTPQGYQLVSGPDGTYHAEQIPIGSGSNGVGVDQAVPGSGANASQAPQTPSVQFQFAPGTPQAVIDAAKAAAAAEGDTGAPSAPVAAGAPQTLAQAVSAAKAHAGGDVIAQRAQQLQELQARGVKLTDDQRQAYLANGRLPSGSDAILAASMDTPLTPAALNESAVDYILKGPRGLPAYAYRDPVTAKQIQNHAGEMLQAAGLSPDMLPAIRGSEKARASALVKMQQQGSMLARNIQSLDANVQLMLQAAQKVGNTNFKSWNALVLAAKGQVSDPDVAAYAQAVMNVLDDYGKVISMSTTSQGTTDTQLRLAQQRISQADGLPALKATAGMIEAGGKNIRDKTDAAIANLTNALKFGNLGTPTSVTPGQPVQQPAPAASAASGFDAALKKYGGG